MAYDNPAADESGAALASMAPWAHAVQGAKILIVDDEPINNRLLERILQSAGYVNLRSTNDPRQVLPICIEFQPDLILLDLQMPDWDGFAVMRQLQPETAARAYLPILILTADISLETKQRALASGARDFLTKPFDRTEVLLRIRNLLETRFLHLHLERRVRERTEDLELARLETLQRLALAAEFRDDNTARHTQRVGNAAAILARALGLQESEVELIRQAAPLHDVGKIAIPDTILLKPGKLTAAEFEKMKSHTAIGARLLSGSRSPALQLGELIARTHHERWDGAGYFGIMRDHIPLASRIVSVVDVYDALTHVRPYKRAWTVEDALAEIEAQRGRQFDPEVAETFLRLRTNRSFARRSRARNEPSLPPQRAGGED